MRLFWKVFTIPFLRKRILPKSNTILDSGTTLAELALGKVGIPNGKVYVALRAGKITFPSQSAMDDTLMEGVWLNIEQLLRQAKCSF